MQVNKAIKRSELLAYIWEWIKYDNPKWKRFKSISSYKKTTHRHFDEGIIAVSNLKKKIRKYTYSLSENLKSTIELESILIYKINYTRKGSIDRKNERMKEAIMWSKTVDKILREAFQKSLIGARSVEFKKFGFAKERDLYFIENGFERYKLKFN